jgi:hypothetical protein
MSDGNFRMPGLFLVQRRTCISTGLYLRPELRSRNYLHSLPGYRAGETDTNNIQRLQDSISQDAGSDRRHDEQRLAYALEHFYGQGVVVTDDKINEIWYQTPVASETAFEFHRPHLKLKLEV